MVPRLKRNKSRGSETILDSVVSSGSGDEEMDMKYVLEISHMMWRMRFLVWATRWVVVR